MYAVWSQVRRGYYVGREKTNGIGKVDGAFCGDRQGGGIVAFDPNGQIEGG